MHQIRSFREGSPTGAKPLPPLEDLLFLFRYDPIAGTLHWNENAKSPRSGRPPKNAEFAGSPDKKGYLRIRVGKGLFKVHRLVWYMHYGEDPGLFLIDHIDRNPSNNRIENLRLVTHSENLINQSAKKGVSGIKGVSWSESTQGWMCHDPRPGCRRYLGTVKTLEEAAARVADAENQPTVSRAPRKEKPLIPSAIPVRVVIRAPRESKESQIQREKEEWEAQRLAKRQATEEARVAKWRLTRERRRLRDEEAHLTSVAERQAAAAARVAASNAARAARLEENRKRITGNQ
jgi:hypothetical protein